MLPAKYRLKDKKSFDVAFREGKTYSNEVLIMKAKPVSAGEITKIGFSAGISFSKKASERNKAKRWMREAVRAKIIKLKPGFHVLFIINSKYSPSRLNLGLIQEKTANLLAKGKLLQ